MNKFTVLDTKIVNNAYAMWRCVENVKSRVKDKVKDEVKGKVNDKVEECNPARPLLHTWLIKRN